MSAAPPATPPAPAQSTAPAPSPAAQPPAPLPLDEKAIADATGVEKPDNAGGVIKASFPRKDVAVAVDGWKMPPFMGLTSWAAFSPGTPGKAEAMVMGDLVLFEDEVNPVMSALFDHGVEVTALHNHFFFDAPQRLFHAHRWRGRRLLARQRGSGPRWTSGRNSQADAEARVILWRARAARRRTTSTDLRSRPRWASKAKRKTAC